MHAGCGDLPQGWDQLSEMKLEGLADAFEELQGQERTADLADAEWLGPLIDREAACRETKRFESRIRSARVSRVGGCGLQDPDAVSTNRCYSNS